MRRIATFSVLMALLLGGCGALRGTPDFPTTLLLPSQAQNLLKLPPAGQSLPDDCNIAALWDDAPGAVGASGMIEKVIAYPGWPQPATVTQATYDAYRNHCIFAYVGAIDLQYDTYKHKTVSLSGGANAIADTMVLGLNTAGAAVGAKETKTILSGIAALVGGAKTNIDSDVLYNNSILAVVAKMDADRNQQLGVILQRVQNDTIVPSAAVVVPAAVAASGGAPAVAAGVTTVAPVQKLASASIQKNVTVTTPVTATAPATTTTTQTTVTTGPNPPVAAGGKKPAAKPPVSAITPAQLPYSMYQASVDLVAYFEAGTFAHALVSLQESAGAQATSCKAQVINLKTTGTKSGSAEGDALANVTPNPTPPASGC